MFDLISKKYLKYLSQSIKKWVSASCIYSGTLIKKYLKWYLLACWWRKHRESMKQSFSIEFSFLSLGSFASIILFAWMYLFYFVFSLRREWTWICWIAVLYFIAFLFSLSLSMQCTASKTNQNAAINRNSLFFANPRFLKLNR